MCLKNKWCQCHNFETVLQDNNYSLTIKVTKMLFCSQFISEGYSHTGGKFLRMETSTLVGACVSWEGKPGLPYSLGLNLPSFLGRR